MRILHIIRPTYCFIISVVIFFSANIALGQTLSSDKGDYPPGATVILTGTGFQAGETVRMQVQHYDVNGDNDTSDAHAPWNIIADGDGNFVTTWLVPADEDELGATLTATADGQSSGMHAEVLFTDAEDQPPECIAIFFLGTDTTIIYPAVPVFTPPTAIDLCDSPVYIIVIYEEIIPGSLPGNYSSIVCWVATDNAGNFSETVCQTINVVTDTTPAAIPVTSCVSYTLPWGEVVTATGEYSHTYTSVNGLDSTVIIHVTINPGYNTTGTPVTACVDYTLPWGQTVTTSGDYSHTYNTVSGCDSMITIHVTINPVYNLAGAPVTACVNYSLPWGQNVSASGDYSHTYSSANGCDSTVAIPVTINPVYNITSSPVTACVNYTLPWGVVVTSSGDYSHSYSSVNGCDSTVTIHATINSAYNITSSPVTACVNYTLPWGVVATSSGDYSHSYSSVNGCDSTVTIHATINSSYNVTGSPVSACVNYTMPWGVVATSSGDYSHSYSSVNGCDSTVTIHATINSVYNITGSPVSACVNYTLPWGVVVTSSGDYSHSYSSVNGCDSTVTIHATINSAYNITGSPVSACVNYTLPWGVVVTSSGDYSHSYSSVNGCDSTVTIHATINSAYNITGSPVTSCVNYTLPWGVVATSSGDYSHSYSSVNGCDSTVTIHATINSAYHITGTSVTTCVSHTLPWGQIVNVSGDYSHNYSSINGCDSIVTIHVTINQNPSPAITGSTSICSGTSAMLSAGAGYTSYLWSTGATTQTLSVSTAGTYSVIVTNSSGCTGSASLTLTVNAIPAPVISGNNSICSGAVSTFNAGSGYAGYLWSTGATTQTISVNTAGTYTATVTNSSGCTGSASLTLTVNANPAPAITGNNSICSGAASTFNAGAGYASYIWSTGATIQTISVNTPAVYTVTVTNSFGCTGSTSGTLTVNANPVAVITGSTSICGGASTTLSAGAGYAGYLWSTGATSQTISVNTAGTYTVTVTNTSGCTAIATTSVATRTNPTATASSNSPVAGGSTLNLTSSGGTSYSWTGPNGAVSTLQNPSIPSVTYLAAGTYTVVVSNSYGCSAVATTTVVTNCTGFKSYTFTQGGWGANPSGNNPAVYRDANFPSAFPTGITIGCGSYWVYLTTSLAVQNFLPSGGTPGVLTQSYTNPGSSLSNSFAGQIAALALNIGFDNYDASFAPTSMQLKNLYVKSGTFVGWTVLQVLNEAQKKLGGCSSTYTVSQLNTACTSINENYDNGTTDKGYLSCVPLRIANVPSLNETNTLKLYPNPSNSLFVIELDLGEKVTAGVELQVLNLLNQVVYVNRVDAIDGILRQEVKFDNNLPNGNYLVRVISGQRVFSEQIIYQK